MGNRVRMGGYTIIFYVAVPISTNPRIGNTKSLYHVFALINKHTETIRIYYDSKIPEID